MGTNSPFLTSKESTLEAEQSEGLFEEPKEPIEYKTNDQQWNNKIGEFAAVLTLDPQKVTKSSLDDTFVSLMGKLKVAFDPETENESPFGTVKGADPQLLGRESVEEILNHNRSNAEEIEERPDMHLTARIDLVIQDEQMVQQEEILEAARGMWNAWVNRMAGDNYLINAEPVSD